MDLRSWMNKNSGATSGAAVIVLVGALVYSIWLSSGGGSVQAGTDQAYWYDAETGEIYPAKAVQEPPWTSPAGNEAWRVHMYTCGACTEEERFVGYYARFASGGGGPSEIASPVQISPDGEKWTSKASPAAERIMEGVGQRCEGEGVAKPCTP